MVQTLTRCFAVLVTVLFVMLLTGTPGEAIASNYPDTIFTNGKVYTINEKQPWAEAIAVKDGKFQAVGKNAEIRALAGTETEVVDLGGKFVMPGVVDAHVHPFDVNRVKEVGNLQFDNQLGAEEIRKAIKKYASDNPDKDWVVAGFYGFGAFPDGKMTKEWLDEVVPDRPAYVVDESVHNATANSKALALAGIDKDTPNPPLGAIDKDPKTGEPTGYLSETAMGLVGRFLERGDAEAFKRMLEPSLSEMTAWGITSFMDMMVNEEALTAYATLERENKLPFRINGAIAMNDYTGEVMTPEEAVEFLPDYLSRSTDKFETNHFKFWADGTPLSYTSLLLEQYADRDTYGEVTMTEEWREDAIQYLGQGMGGHIHAIGDGTVRYVLDLVEEAHKRYPGKVRRFHMGHSILVDPDDYERFLDLDVVAEIGPSAWYPSPAQDLVTQKLGENRAESWFNVRGMLDAGIRVAWGSDWPSGTPDGNPFRGLEGLVTRAHPWDEYEGTWGTPISLEEGLYIITMGGAYAMEREDSIGSIEQGKYADFIVLESNLFEIPPQDLDSVRVLRTVFEGEAVYQAKE